VKLKTVVIVVTLILAVVLGIQAKKLLQSRQTRAAKTPTPRPAVLSVTLTRGTTGSMARSLEVLARVEAERRITLSTKLAGYIRQIPVHESQPVSKGDLLVRIDSAELRSALTGLESTLQARIRDRELAESIYQRNLKLYAAGGLAKEALDASEVALSNKKALEKGTREQIVQLRNQLNYLEIRAPFDGTVDRLLLREGDLAATGKPILSLVSRERKLLFSYTPSPENDVRPDQPVRADGKRIATVRRRYVSAASGLAQAEASLEAPLDLPTGSNLPVSVELERLDGCLLSGDTLLHRSDGSYLMLYHDSRFQAQKVNPLLEQNDKVLLHECPDFPVAQASESKLARLPSYGRVIVTEGNAR